MDNVTDAATQLVKKPQEMLSYYIQSHWHKIAALFLVAIVLSFGVALLVYNMLNHGAAIKNFFVEPTKEPLKGTQLMEISKLTGIPTNSKEGSIGFWLYVESFDRYQGTFGHVFHRGTRTDTDPLTMGPFVFVDNTSNKLHVGFKSSIPSPSNIPNTYDAKMRYASSCRGISIDYVPSNRWVHIMITVNVNKTVIAAYLDGQLVKKRYQSNKAFAINTTTFAPSQFDKLDIFGSGNLLLGGSESSTVGAGFFGLLSSMTFYDKALPPKEVYMEYMKGPVPSALSRMGIPAYGVRTPIYRISEKFSMK